MPSPFSCKHCLHMLASHMSFPFCSLCALISSLSAPTVAAILIESSLCHTCYYCRYNIVVSLGPAFPPSIPIINIEHIVYSHPPLHPTHRDFMPHVPYLCSTTLEFTSSGRPYMTPTCLHEMCLCLLAVLLVSLPWDR